jgi:hypothetical protein
MNNKGAVLMGLIASLAVAAGVGCSHDMPDQYGERRPPVTELDGRDRGLQSKDVVQASDEMAMKLLADPDLNASKDQWLMVVDSVQNDTVSARHSLDIFLQRLQTNLARHGKGRVQLIQNRAKLRDLQARELEVERSDGQPGPKGIQPDYSLSATISELPNRGTSYYYVQFEVTDLRDRRIAFTDAYEVRVAR